MTTRPCGPVKIFGIIHDAFRATSGLARLLEKLSGGMRLEDSNKRSQR